MKIRYWNLRSLVVLPCLFLISFGSFSQGVKNSGAKIVITNSTYFIIDNGGFTNMSTSGSQVTNAGTIDVDGDWVNDNTTNVFGATPTTTTGGVVRLDGAAQNIGGSEETRFYNLEVKGTGKKTLTGTGVNPGIRTYGVLTLASQSLKLNAKNLWIENSATTAIVRTGVNNNNVISETPPSVGYGRLRWNVGSALGNYTIPFGTDAAIPIDIAFKYNITTAGTPSSSYKTFATYPTNDLNTNTGGANWSDLPDGVTHLTDDYIQPSHYWVIDRFWIVDEDNLATHPGYTTKPRIEYVFKYAENEATQGNNHIDQAKLAPQRYNWVDNKWGDWLYGVPGSITDPLANTTTVQIATNSTVSNTNEWKEDMYPVWTLVDNSDPLPIELVRFAGQCADGTIEIRWSTYTETNNDFFTVERSNNGTDFEIVDVIQGAGNSNQPLSYNVTDQLPYGGTSYYRLKNTDFDGKSKYSEIIAVTCGTDGNDFSFVNAYDVDHTEIVVEFTGAENEKFSIMLYDASGRRALDFQGAAVEGMNKVRLPSGDLARGIYIINLSNNIKNFSKRVMLH